MKNKILLLIVVLLSIGTFFIPKKDTEIVIVEDKSIMVNLLDETDGSIESIELEEYIIGVVAAEMPALFDIEALKAQAVASRTYALYKVSASNTDYDLIIGTKNQGYKNNQELMEMWGTSFFTYYLKIRSAVMETKGEVVTYDGEIIESFYFSMSNGYTENSELVFQEVLPYLTSVSSFWEEDSTYTYTFSQDEFCNLLGITCNGIFIEDTLRSSTNRVNSIIINGVSFKGTEVRNLLSLRSTDFTISIEDEVVITTKGYGHGVGMSQYGANGMAKEGYGYQDILKYYYQNTEIMNIYD